MDPRVVSAIIAFVGVVLSVIISYVSNRQLFKSKVRELELQTIQQNSALLQQKRLDYFPDVYFILSQMIKNVRKDRVSGKVNLTTKESVKDFLSEYEKINSKYGLLFSSQSSIVSAKLRSYLYDLDSKEEDINLENLKELTGLMARLELSLKQDVGVYIEEFQDLEVGKNLTNYYDTEQLSPRLRKMKSELNV